MATNILDQLKGLITTAYSPEATKTMSPSDTPQYQQALSLLGSNYGYNPQVSDFIMGTLSGTLGGDQIRDRYRQLGGGTTDPQWGNTYDVEKNYGSLESLATYLAQGGQSQTSTAPTITNQYGGQQGGNVISTPTGQLPTGITPLSSSAYENTPNVSSTLASMVPGTPREQFANLAYKPGTTTVWNPTSGTAYGSPEQLAGAMGLSALPENWQEQVPGYSSTPGAVMSGGGGATGGTTGGGAGGTTGGSTGNSYMDFANEIMESWKSKQAGIKAAELEINKIEEELNQLESDIDKRISENSATGGVITTAHKNRYMASESAPNRALLAQLLHAQAGLESGATGDINYFNMAMKAAEYQTPEQKFAAMKAEEEMKAKIKQQYDPEKPATTSDITEYEYAKTQGYKGTLEQWTKAKAAGSNVYAATTLDELAKLGYTRRHSASGVGWDFFKSGKPITAEQISKEQGISIADLLEGSDNPADIKIIESLKPKSSTDLFGSF